jgi:uncharacterized membrane protein YwaF
MVKAIQAVYIYCEPELTLLTLNTQMNTNYLFILKAGLIDGPLDIFSAFFYYFVKTGKSVLNVLKQVASGLFGKKAL